MPKVINLIIISTILFIIGVFFISLTKNPGYNTKDLVGKVLTEISLKSFDENKTLTNNDLKKKDYTLINFWASWCGPCRNEHPILMKLSEEKNLQLLGVNFKDKKIKAKFFLEDLGNPYDYLAKDELGKKAVYFGVYGIPESILVDRDFLILKKFIGPLSDKDYNQILKITN